MPVSFVVPSLDIFFKGDTGNRKDRVFFVALQA